MHSKKYTPYNKATMNKIGYELFGHTKEPVLVNLDAHKVWTVAEMGLLLGTYCKREGMSDDLKNDTICSATDMATLFPRTPAPGDFVEFSYMNVDQENYIDLIAGTGGTEVGNMRVLKDSSGVFRIQWTSRTAYELIRRAS